MVLWWIQWIHCLDGERERESENFPLRIKQSTHRSGPIPSHPIPSHPIWSDPIHKHIVSPASVCLIKMRMFPFAFRGNYRAAWNHWDHLIHPGITGDHPAPLYIYSIRSSLFSVFFFFCLFFIIPRSLNLTNFNSDSPVVCSVFFFHN